MRTDDAKNVLKNSAFQPLLTRTACAFLTAGLMHIAVLPFWIVTGLESAMSLIAG